MRRKVRASGVVISNLLPTPGMSWRSLMAESRVGPGVLVEFAAFYNRVLIQGRAVGGAREAGMKLRGALRGLGSRMAEGLTVKLLKD
jgi:hypothetical protein